LHPEDQLQSGGDQEEDGGVEDATQKDAEERQTFQPLIQS
jgi:hypothetical protein